MKMSSGRLLILALVFALGGGCGSIETETDHNPSVNFALYKTYDWAPMPAKNPGDKDPRVDNELMDSRVRNAVEGQLDQKGYQRAVGGNADFLVWYEIELEQKRQANSQRTSWSGSYGPTYGGAETYVRLYEEGTLVLDFLDRKTGVLLWRGTARAEVLQSASPEERQERMSEAVRLLLEQFPPDPPDG